MEIATDENELANFQRKFIEKLKEMDTDVNEIMVGWTGGNLTAEAHYSSKLGIWFVSSEAENRYWNAFGVGKPKLTGSNSIIVEINFPFRGRDRRIAGIFIKENEKVLVCHSGKIGGGRPDIGYRTFWKEYSGQQIKSPEGEIFAQIGYLDSDDFPERVKDFVVEVNRIKNIIAEKGSEIFEETVEEEIKEMEFSLTVERDIQNYLANNLENLEKDLKLHQTEYLTDTGRIDILAIDKNSDFVVIEVKAGIADIPTFGQISSYMGAVQKELGKGKRVRGIIVASEFDEKLKVAILTNPSISLKKYKVNFQFEGVD